MDQVILRFDVLCNYDAEDVQDLGQELAVFLQESLFNGEDVLNVEFVGYLRKRIEDGGCQDPEKN